MTMDHNDRITREHRARDAVIYPRQSSAKQVKQNVESTRIQIGLREKAIALGWPRPTVIDEDLAISASGFAERTGFQQMLTRVTMREIGMILCVDASRLSRNSKDWAQLFELCGYFNTLIADLDQVYDLSRPNDRMVLGIKGTVAELELGILKSRLKSGADAKAARGELRINLPPGYVYDPSGQMVFDPDQRVQKAVHRMFDQFKRFTSVRQLGMWYRNTDTLFPVKKPGREGGALWQVPNLKTIYRLLEHPAYAGAYVYGRHVTHIECTDGKLRKRIREVPLEEWRVCIRDHHPAYISWKRFLANRTRVRENRPQHTLRPSLGAIRDGLALLTGLLRCGQCGGRIRVTYRKTRALYFCDGEHTTTSKRCQSFSSKRIDHGVSEQLCRAVEPLAIDAALQAADMKEKQKTEKIACAVMQVEAAQYEADRVFEQFDLCDPKNRLVADSLEERLNQKLAEVQSAKERLESLSAKSDALTEADRRRLRGFAVDFPEVWNHPDADPKLKKRLLRCAIHEILVEPEAEQTGLKVTIHWKGGVHTIIHVKRSNRSGSYKTDLSILKLVSKLAEDVDDAQIARILNLQQLTTLKGLRWNKDRVQSFRKIHRIPKCKPERNPNYLTMNEAWAYLGISKSGLFGLVKLGAIHKNQITRFAPWRVSREELDSEHVQHLVKVLKATGRLPRGGYPEGQLSLFDD